MFVISETNHAADVVLHVQLLSVVNQMNPVILFSERQV